MTRRILASFAAIAAIAACAPAAESHEEAVGAASASDALAEVLASDLRAEDRARDQYRHPGETLAFFRIEPTMTVAEYGPGGGWYTRILAPYLVQDGQYIAVNFPPEGASSLGEDFVARVRQGGETFSARQSEAMQIPAEKLPFHFGNAIPDEINGTVDRVLIFRMMHNLKRWGLADSEIEALFKALKPGGLLGVVQHRAKADAPAEYVDGNKGYLKEDELIAFFEGKGFELVGTSEINANPKDTADYEAGVWTLPPSYAKGDEDRAKYTEIGESDRMTLLFRKPE
ncbi:class I SAM-dependent methyltransferase [Erythrobacter sp. JK5]|uniref:class I SAM-dependent methyltransferase n=1 Tax=Erythrobacter sp. JK5 TaxID=2829500 RepID=UPI001BA4D597|nr:class I SAM-dependent methyltransferase [Erythrobacter sp. JK5]QUL36845.1 class I SAM-dependent methyltransferase [Erythrobacter sp. JK5]